MRKVTVNAGGVYPIFIGPDIGKNDQCEAALGGIVKGRNCLLVSDDNVEPIYGRDVIEILTEAGAAHVSSMVFPAGEKAKTLDTVKGIYEKAVAAGLDRESVLVALGGGVPGDVGGFVAATYMRGIDFIQWPTTLLAQVDSSVGGKVGVDLPEGKNLVGAFYQPRLVVADLSTLHTLPEEEFRCGLAETVKYGMIMDADFMQFLQREREAIKAREPSVMEKLVSQCCRLKGMIVEEDEKEGGRRQILNYGHTFGHALEVLAGYGTMSHGDAVAVGMTMAAALSVEAGLCSLELLEEQGELLRCFGLPTKAPFSFSGKDALEIMRRDKKSRSGRIRVILPTRIGHVQAVEDIDELLLARTAEKYQ